MQRHNDNPRGISRIVDYVTERKVRLAEKREKNVNDFAFCSIFFVLFLTVMIAATLMCFISSVKYYKFMNTDNAIIGAFTFFVASVPTMMMIREFEIRWEDDVYVRFLHARDSFFTREDVEKLLSLVGSAPLNIMVFDSSKRQKADHILKSGVDVMEKLYFGRSAFEYVVLCGDEDFALHMLTSTGHDITNGSLARGIEILEFVIKYGTLNLFNMVKMLITDFHPEWEGNLHDIKYVGVGVLTDVSKDVIIQNLGLVELL